MILYANGCSHTAAAEAVVSAAFAEDDGRHGIDRRPHPLNLKASWCNGVARALNRQLICEAESGGSNPRILRTTRDWIAKNKPLLSQTLFVIQWTTWEREEWLHNGVYYQVNASGKDWVPRQLRNQYQHYVVNIDYDQKTQQAHNDIWAFHKELESQNINHVFFSGHSTFSDIVDQHDWGRHYIQPYQRSASFYNWLKNNGGRTAKPTSYHFDAASHRLWAQFVLQYLLTNHFVSTHSEIPAD